jgi:PmbA protein
VTDDLADLTDRMLAAARAAGADSADAMAVLGIALSIDVRDGRLEQAERAEGIDLGLRVFVGRRGAIVSGRDTRPETLAEMASRAVLMAREAPEDPCAGIADPAELATDRDMSRLDLVDGGPEPEPAALEAAARAAEAAARAVPGITRMDSTSASYSAQRIHLAASNGFSAGYGRTDHSLTAVAIAGEGTAMERDYDHDSRVHRGDLRSPEEIGRTAAERTVARLGARKPPTGVYPVLFDERIAGSLVGHLLSAINGSMIARGSSWLRDALGAQVLPRGISLIEDPHRPRIGPSRLFDAEGLPTRRRAIVEDGILTGWTLDLATARRIGMQSTGNAARSPAGQPSPSVTNVALSQGSASREDLLRDMGRGLLVTSLIGSTINPNTGDYSRGAAGFWVEGGEIAWPVNECTVAGNLRDMLLRIVPANDARAYLSRVVPSILIDRLSVAGA